VDKNVPIRTCVGCGRTGPKKELIRLVRGSDRAVGIDPTGGQAGRGAYLCPKSECLGAAMKRNRISRALGVAIGDIEPEVIGEEFNKHIKKVS